MKLWQIVSIILCVFLGVFIYLKHPYQPKLSIITPLGEVSYFVEIADTPQKHQTGLMNRTKMPPNHGMFFIFEEEKTIVMWMKNTYIPLDMLFVDADGIIRHIHENAQPLDETRIICPTPVKYVIELNAGQVKKNQIQIGNMIRGFK